MISTLSMTEVEKALMGVVGHLVSELSKEGVVDTNRLVDRIKVTAAVHRSRGSTSHGEALHQLAEYLINTVEVPPAAVKREVY